MVRMLMQNFKSMASLAHTEVKRDEEDKDKITITNLSKIKLGRLKMNLRIKSAKVSSGDTIIITLNQRYKSKNFRPRQRAFSLCLYKCQQMVNINNNNKKDKSDIMYYI